MPRKLIEVALPLEAINAAAAKEKSIVGFVGHVDPGADFEGHVRRFAKNPVFRGLRWSSGHLVDESKKDVVKAGARLLAELGLELDLNSPCTGLPAASKLAAEVPELRVTLPPTAIGKDFLAGGQLAARTPSGTGFQLSFAGIIGITLAMEEGVEVNLLGLVVGVDPKRLAIKVPGIGEVGPRLWSDCRGAC